MDLSAITDPQLIADLDHASKRYAASKVGELLAQNPGLTASELHRILLDEAQAAHRPSSFPG